VAALFSRSKLDDGGELLVHVEESSLVLANVTGTGKTVWQKRMSFTEARGLRRFLASQNLGNEEE
jgi:hypothetical protein